MPASAAARAHAIALLSCWLRNQHASWCWWPMRIQSGSITPISLNAPRARATPGASRRGDGALPGWPARAGEPARGHITCMAGRGLDGVAEAPLGLEELRAERPEVLLKLLALGRRRVHLRVGGGRDRAEIGAARREQRHSARRGVTSRRRRSAGPSSTALSGLSTFATWRRIEAASAYDSRHEATLEGQGQGSSLKRGCEQRLVAQ